MGDVNFLDRALRGLTRAAADGHGELPDVVAARLTNDALDLILAVPNHEPPAPWRSDDAGTTWTLNRDDQDQQRCSRPPRPTCTRRTRRWCPSGTPRPGSSGCWTWNRSGTCR